MSTVFWTNLHHDYKGVLRQETERLAAEIRQIRSKVLAREPEKSTGEYPAGGYGVHFYNSPPRYIIFADNNDSAGYDDGVDKKMIERFFSDDITELVELSGGRTDFYFRFKGPNEAYTNITDTTAKFYVIGVVATDYRGNIRLGEDTEDGFLWTNMSVTYDDIDEADPSGGGGGGKINIELPGGG